MLSMVEGEARLLLRGFDPLHPPSAEELVRARLGHDVIRTARLQTDAETTREWWGVDRIAVRYDLDPVRRRWAILHELAEIHLHRLDYDGEDVEDVAQLLTAALAAPREAFLELLALGRTNFRAIARELSVTETCAALRLGEVTGEPVAVVTPRRVRIRGDEWGWPPEPVLRQLATTRRLPASLSRVSLRDERGRRVLLAG